MKQLAGMKLFRKADLDYDFFVCLDDMAVRYLVHEVPHLYYMLTPRRALYDMYYLFLEEKGLARPFYWGILNASRFSDRRFVRRRVRSLACISHTVRNRIFKAYGRDSVVVYPPVEAGRYSWKPSEGYWLSVGRVDKWKRIEIQIEAFREMPELNLFVVGGVYPRFREVTESAPPNVKFIGNVSEPELLSLYSRCEGFLTTAIDEDFGITPVEAMASGKPVVATKEGGYLETVVDGHTGILVPPEPAEIRAAIKSISEDPSLFRDACIRQASLFDYGIFRSRIRGVVKRASENWS
jgi:glycosyltransferase involved in cell wall biosynthesis